MIKELTSHFRPGKLSIKLPEQSTKGVMMILILIKKTRVAKDAMKMSEPGRDSKVTLKAKVLVMMLKKNSLKFLFNVKSRCL